MASGGKLWETPRIREGLRDFFAVYHDVVDSVQRSAEDELADHPLLGPIFRGFSEESRQQQRETSRARMKGVEDGDWDSYQAHLRHQGAFFALMSVRFSDWYDVTRVLQRGMTVHLIARYVNEPARLATALEAMSLFYDRAMAEIGDSFIEAKERAVRQEGEKLTALIASLQEGVVLADNDGKVILRNPAAVALASDVIESIHDKRLQNRYYREGSDDPIPLDHLPVARALRGERVVDEVLVRRISGAAPVYLSVTAGPITTNDGDRFGAVASFRDISVRRELEAERVRTADAELRSKHLIEASRLKSEFLANMSHELRTPLNSIIGFAELLHDGEVGALEDQQREFVRDILKSGEHLLQLINDILDLSKVEAGRMDFYSEPVRMREVIDEVSSMLRHIAQNKQIGLQVVADATVDEVHLDPSRFKQILYNLLSNALKFTPAGGSVIVRTLPERDGEFRLEVEDTGIGIAPEDQARLFVDFQQLRAGAAKTHAGTGLGLALTRRLVEAQGGSIGVSSSLGEGSTFFVTLPRRVASTDEHRPSIQHFAPRAVGAQSVLVVEDDPSDATIIVDTLAAAGFAVELASTGTKALELASAKSFDAVTLDLILPDMSGLEVLRRIRTETPNGTAPVLVISVVTEHVLSGFVVTDVLSKPVQPTQLLESLSRTGVSEVSRGTVVVVDDDLASLRLMASALGNAKLPHVCFSDSQIALDHVRTSRASAIVLDLKMPTLDGFAFLRALRADPEHATVPVIVWTVLELTKEQLLELHQLAQRVVRKDGATASLVRELEVFLPPRVVDKR